MQSLECDSFYAVCIVVIVAVHIIRSILIRLTAMYVCTQLSCAVPGYQLYQEACVSAELHILRSGGVSTSVLAQPSMEIPFVFIAQKPSVAHWIVALACYYYSVAKARLLRNQSSLRWLMQPRSVEWLDIPE